MLSSKHWRNVMLICSVFTSNIVMLLTESLSGASGMATRGLNNWPVRGRTSYPLLFDRNGQPKLAFNAVIQAAAAK